MSSEGDPVLDETTTPPSSPNCDIQIQQDSRLIRSASENSQLARCWAEERSSIAEKSSAIKSLKSSFMSGSVSLQEISSLMSALYNNLPSAGTDVLPTALYNNLPSTDDLPTEANLNHQEVNERINLSSSSSKQQNVQIPDVVFEDKESDANDTGLLSKSKAQMTHRGELDSPPNVIQTGGNDCKSFFFWTAEQVKEKQVEQIGASACGATAVINVMNVLDLHPDLEIVASAVQTNLRSDDAPLPEYLFSRSVAGATHEALIQGLDKATNGSVYSRFFALYPKRKMNLKQWLADWMRLGAVPLATLNLQRAPVSGDIPDAWHHQMIYGVDREGIYMCNPIIMETEEHIQPQLCSESVLLVRRFDVLKRWHKDSNLSSLTIHKDSRWKDMDVLGQAVNMLLDEPPCKDISEEDDSNYEKELTDWFMRCHIRIPAAYMSGITLCVRKDNVEGYRRLQEACIDLPLDDSDS